MQHYNGHRSVLLEVYKTDDLHWQAKLKGKLWTTIFRPSLSYRGAIISANNFIRTHKLRVANKNKVSKNFYNLKEEL